MIYHRGFLAMDREVNQVLHKTARDLYRAARKGKVMLTQRKLGDGDYEYIATFPKKKVWHRGENNRFKR